MAFVECEFCHKKISEKAKSCPHCGTKTLLHWYNNDAMGFVLLLVVAFSLFLAYM